MGSELLLAPRRRVVRPTTSAKGGGGPILVGPGARFGRMVVVAESEPYLWRGRPYRRQWRCECDCGAETVVREDALKSGHSLSCGCLRVDTTRVNKTVHRGRQEACRTPEYEAWQTILHRRADAAVCARWRAPGGLGFLNFLEDVGARPSARHRLVRLDRAGGYIPENCAWRTDEKRAGCPRRLLVMDGEQITIRQAAERHGLCYRLLCKRLQRGWRLEHALRR